MIKIDKVSFCYGEDTKADNGIRDISLAIRTGEFVVLCGKSGCGKTTLTRIINGLIPHFYEGQLTGTVHIDDYEVTKEPLARTAGRVGSVFQNPRSQFFNVDTTGELAFGCENMGIAADEIWKRIEDATARFELAHLRERSIFELSGGEKQRIACASVYAVHPDIIVLDEPSSNLDAPSVEKLRQVLQKLKEEGKTIVISEHRLHYLAGLADRFIYMENGCITYTFQAEEMWSMRERELAEKGLRCLNIKSIKKQEGGIQRLTGEKLSICSLVCKYSGKPVLDVPELCIHKGEILAIIGPNGAGKSTFAGCLCGIIKHKGRFDISGKPVRAMERLKNSYMVMQDVNHQLFTESVLEEVTLGAKDKNAEEARAVLAELELENREDSHPLALSGGQKQRVAIAGAMCAGKQFLIYDEPTSGLDFVSMRSTCRLIRKAAKSAFLSAIITHDIEFILECCTAVLYISGGTVCDYYPLDETGVSKVKDFFYHSV
jgi:energy-coupling factor transporter ATP-binding protein EcfA2